VLLILLVLAIADRVEQLPKRCRFSVPALEFEHHPSNMLVVLVRLTLRAVFTRVVVRVTVRVSSTENG
jgi:hypothetical protein